MTEYDNKLGNILLGNFKNIPVLESILDFVSVFNRIKLGSASKIFGVIGQMGTDYPVVEQIVNHYVKELTGYALYAETLKYDDDSIDEYAISRIKKRWEYIMFNTFKIFKVLPTCPSVVKYYSIVESECKAMYMLCFDRMRY